MRQAGRGAQRDREQEQEKMKATRALEVLLKHLGGGGRPSRLPLANHLVSSGFGLTQGPPLCVQGRGAGGWGGGGGSWGRRRAAGGPVVAGGGGGGGFFLSFFFFFFLSQGGF